VTVPTYCPWCGAKMVTVLASVDSLDMNLLRLRCDNSTCAETFELTKVVEEQKR